MALDILLDALDEWPARAAMRRGESEAELLHQDFKAEILAKLNQRMGWRLYGVVVADWIVSWKNRNWRRYDNFVLAREERALLEQMGPFEELFSAGTDLTPDQQSEWQRLRDQWDDLQGRYVNEH